MEYKIKKSTAICFIGRYDGYLFSVGSMEMSRVRWNDGLYQALRTSELLYIRVFIFLYFFFASSTSIWVSKRLILPRPPPYFWVTRILHYSSVGSLSSVTGINLLAFFSKLLLLLLLFHLFFIFIFFSPVNRKLCNCPVSWRWERQSASIFR